jgi:ABC-type antimicrobial peptide transport system permease subunit
VYGLAAYSVAQRRTEIGIRMALGATAGRVLRLLFSQTGKAVLGGLAVGAVCAAWAARFAESLFYGMSSGSLWVYAAAAAMLLAAGALAIAGPSLRAAHLDPAETLRSE